MTEVLSVREVHWTCPGGHILKGVSLDVAPGECVAICGENGAGKTSLLRIITGLLHADSGTVTHSGGIGLVHQHFSLVPALTVAENVFLGQEPMRFGLFDHKRAEAETKKLAEKAKLDVDVQARVESLSVGARQRVELLKALRTADKLLLLDEPTAVLGPRDIDSFLGLVQSLKESGLAVVFISHKLHEVARIADRVLVLRHGKIVLEARPIDTPLQAIADAMVGQTGGDGFHHAAAHEETEIVAVLEHVSAGSGRDHIDDLNLVLKKATVTGIAGVEGNGQHGLFSVLVGLLEPEGGHFTVHDASITSCSTARAAGVRCVPADRHELAMLPGHDINDNLLLGALVQKNPQAVLERFDVRPPDPSFDAMRLSGGNQQKLVFARELGASGAASVLVVHEPTRGVDFLAKERLWKEIEAARTAGTAVVVISSDLDELRALCDRVLVLFRGKLGPETRVEDASDERLAAAMAGL